MIRIDVTIRPVGVELAGELAVHYPDKSVTMMHRGSHLLSRACAETSAYADITLKEKRVISLHCKSPAHDIACVPKKIPNHFVSRVSTVSPPPIHHHAN